MLSNQPLIEGVAWAARGSGRFVILASIALASAQTNWKHVSTFEFDWDGRKGVQVALHIAEPSDSSGGFTRIRISVPGQKAFILTAKTGWERLVL